MKMFVQCPGCGFTRVINLEGDFDAQEQQFRETLLEGWRFASAWDNFVCPRCAQAGGSTDKLFALVAGTPRICGTLVSYVELRDRAERFMHEMRTLG